MVRHGRARQTLSDAAAIQANVAYDPWGQVQSGTVPTFGFTGELQQGANVYLRARWYNASRGTFTAKDPFAGRPEQPYSLQPYQYAYAAPTTWTDPRGRCAPWIDRDCQFLSWDQVRQGNLNWEDGRTYWTGVGQTVYGAVAGPVDTVYDVATDANARAEVGRGWNALWNNPVSSARTVATVALTPFTDTANGIMCGDANQLGRGLTGYALLLGGARLARKPLTDAAQTPSVQNLSPRLQRDMIADGGGPVDIQNAPYIVPRLIRDQDWSVWGTDALATRAGDFTYLTQSSTVQEALSRIPRSWMMKRQESGVGYKFINPDSTAPVTEVRIKVPMARFNRDWRSFAQLRLGKDVGPNYPGADRFNMIYYDRNLQLTTDTDAMHIRLSFDP